MTDRLYKMLRRPGRIRERIAQAKLKKDRLYNSMLPSGIRYDADKVKSSPRDPMPAYIEEAEEIDALIRSLKAELRKAEEEIMEATAVLDKTGADIIRYRYVNGLSWEAVAREICYSRRHMFRIYRETITKLDHSLTRGNHKDVN